MLSQSALFKRDLNIRNIDMEVCFLYVLLNDLLFTNIVC